MRKDPPDKKNLLLAPLRNPKPRLGDLEVRREVLEVQDEATGETYEIFYPHGKPPSPEQIADIMQQQVLTAKAKQTKDDTEAFERAKQNPIFERPQAEPAARESLGLTYPGVEMLGRIGGSVKNFFQGVTAEGLRNFNAIDPENASPEMAPNVGRALLEVLGYQNARPRLVAGLDAAAAGDGARRIGEVSPEFAPGTIKGTAYNVGTTLGGDVLPFTPITRIFAGPSKAAEVLQAAPRLALTAEEIALQNATKAAPPSGALPPDLVPRPRIEPPVKQGTGGVYTRTSTEPGEVLPTPPVVAPPMVNTAPEPSKLRIATSKAGQTARNVLGVSPALRASFDLSGPRQGAILGARRPGLALKAGKDMIGAALSEDVFQGQQKALARRANAPHYKEHGLFLSDTTDAAKMEEWFAASELAEKIPLVGRVVRGSNRAMSSYLNRLRADTFDKTADAWARQGVTPQSHPKEFDALSEWLNVATGRGDLGALEKAAPVLQGVFFGPRWQASRLQVLNPATYAKMPRMARVEALKDVAAASSAALSLMLAAKMGGAKVTLDPRHTDFGKIIIGDTRVDLGAGFLPWIRFFTEMATDEHITTGNNKKNVDRLTRPIEEASKKLSPIASYLVDAWREKDVTGKKFDPADRAVQLAIPMFLADAKEAMRQEGLTTGGLLSVPGLFGAGLATFENPEGKAAPFSPADKRNTGTRIPHQYMEGPGGWIVDAPGGKPNAPKAKKAVPRINPAEARKAVRKLLLDDERLRKKELRENPRQLKGNDSLTQPGTLRNKPDFGRSMNPRTAGGRQ